MVELWVGAHLLQFHRADSIRVARVLSIHPAPNWLEFPGRWIRLAIAGSDHVVDFLEALATLASAHNDLNAIEITFSWIFYRPKDECGRPTFLAGKSAPIGTPFA